MTSYNININPTVSSIENGLNEECGIFAVYNADQAERLCYEGLLSLQHRGQEAGGIVTSNGSELSGYKNEGYVADIFDEKVLDDLSGMHGIAHVRYSTQGGGGIMNVQPFLFYHSTADFALCHNGNLINAKELRTNLEQSGSLFQSTSDSEIIAHLLKKQSHLDFYDRLCNSLTVLDGAFSYLFLKNNELYAARDKYGLRPLVLGKYKESYVLSSESAAFASMGATLIRDILPGEVIKITEEGIASRIYATHSQKSLCSLEFIYFARADSTIDAVSVYEMRKRSGQLLFDEAPVKADIVVGIPETSLPAAIGYAQSSKLPLEMGFVKNKFSSRTFIEPTQDLRERAVKMKLSPIQSVVAGKRIVLIDDSIVRGTTTRKLVKHLKELGALEVHLRIASPPLVAPCYYGVDIPTYHELIAAQMSVDEIKERLNVDSLHYLSLDGLYQAAEQTGLCLAYFNHEYPTALYSFEHNQEAINP